MAGRGFLIWPFFAEIEPIDTSQTEAAGEYDHRFREPRKRDGLVRTKYGPKYRLPCQVETEAGGQEALRMMIGGDSPLTLMQLVFHFQDLEDAGRVDGCGKATIRKMDRLSAIYDRDGNFVESWCRVPLYCNQIQSRSFGLLSHRRNLCLTTWMSKDKSTFDVG